jgi:hypothetical protein
MHTLILGGKPFVINEPVFKDLKQILAALNRLNQLADDANLVADIQIILTCLIGEANVAKFRRFCWEAWKIPAPSPEELLTLLNALPEICGLTTSTSQSSEKSDDWDALYWRVARVTGWTFSQIDTEMTLSRLTALSEHLAEKPLTDDLVAAYLDYEYQKPRTLEDAIDDHLGMTNGNN